MPMDDTGVEQVDRTESFIERVGLYIPIYKGYKEQNLRRDEDRAIRQELVLTIEAVKENLKIIREASSESVDLTTHVNKLDENVDEFLELTKEMVNGHSGWHASANDLREELDELVSWDAKLIDDTVLLRTTVADLVNRIDRGEYAIMTPLKEIERVLDRLAEDYDGRESIMRKFLEQE